MDIGLYRLIIVATRLLPLLPINGVVIIFSYSKLISVGINLIDHIFIPSVLTALVGFLALWIDKDGDGIPDKLEEPPKLPINLERGIQNDRDNSAESK